MLDCKAEGMGIRWTFGNPGEVFFCILFGWQKKLTVGPQWYVQIVTFQEKKQCETLLQSLWHPGMHLET